MPEYLVLVAFEYTLDAELPILRPSSMKVAEEEAVAVNRPSSGLN